MQHQPPGYPFPEQLDEAKITAGQKLFALHCASCHGNKGARTGTVIPLEEIGTDPHRARMWTKAAVDRYHAFSDGYPRGLSTLY